uniref:NADH dehydrogenase [ubiquinone] 1 alpha subcomplex subunit 6 n=1 Tax=Clastoptera arizonana TaxID=38151 RepID=A0A1B6CPM9_9HEMI
MSSSQAAKAFVKQVKPILSLDKSEAKKRVLNLYKAWYRQVPYIVMDYDIPKDIKDCRAKLREEFTKHKSINDIRVIDMLVIKGQMELKECVNKWKTKAHVMTYWKDSLEPKPNDFMSKFMAGSE